MVVAAAAAMGLAACGSSSSPHVASLSGSNSSNHGGSPTTTLPKGNPTQLLDEWASCMRTQGDPDQVDPTIDANKVIHITFPASANAPGRVGGKGRGGPCGAYLTAASTALRGGQPLPKPDPAKLEKFSQCMRANGIPDFPDPSGGGLSIQSIPAATSARSNPTFQNAVQAVRQEDRCAAVRGHPAGRRHRGHQRQRPGRRPGRQRRGRAGSACANGGGSG